MPAAQTLSVQVGVATVTHVCKEYILSDNYVIIFLEPVS